MKLKIYSKAAFVMIVMVVLTSCKDLFDTQDIKVNPNAPSEDLVSINALLTGTLVAMSAIHEDTDTRIAYMWAGQLAGLSRQHAGFGNYTVAASTFDNSWAILYPATANARIIQQKATPTNNRLAIGIGQVIEALLMTKATSLYGDIPYSQAFDFEKYPKPVFDKQAAVYASLIALLETAYQNLDSGIGEVDGGKEFIYGGDATSWAQAAKTLQARLYLHLGDYPKAIAAANLGIASTDGDALIPHGTAQTIDNNLNFDFFENSRPGDTGFDDPAYLPVFMKTRLDEEDQPLVPIVTKVKNNKKDTLRSSTSSVIASGVDKKRQHKATRNSKTDETALYNHFIQLGVYSSTGTDPNTIDGMFTADASHPLLTFYENQLILAEAYARLATPDIASSVDALNSVRSALSEGYINGQTIGSLYQSFGIQYDPYDEADFSSGGIANPASTGWNQQMGLIYEILSQKYIVMLAQYEVFTDVRRSAKALPIVKLPIPLVIGTVAPQRFIYPQNEINTNPGNVPSPLPDQYTKLPIFQ